MHVRSVTLAMALVMAVGAPAARAGSTWDERSPTQRAGYTSAAAAMNFVPFVSALAEPRCFEGYILCKSLFAGFSVLAAGTQLIASGGGDMEQTRNLLRRGFGGNWYLTGRHLAGDEKVDVFPQVAAPRGNAPKPGFEPPPL